MVSMPDKPRPITLDQFKDAAKRLLLSKSGTSEVSDDHEPTQEELEEVVRVESDQDQDKKGG